MQIVTNLVKLTDYPFVYSMVGLFLAMNGHRLNLESLSFSTIGPLITVIGLFATLLSIVDPFGNLLRFIIRRGAPVIFLRRTDSYKTFWIEEYTARAIETNWISYEIDKIVSTIYFLIIMIVILLALNNQPFLNDIFRSFGFSGNTTCTDDQCKQIVGKLSSNTGLTMSNVSGQTLQFLERDDFKIVLSVIIVISIIGIIGAILFAVLRLMNHSIAVGSYLFSDQQVIGLSEEELKVFEYFRKGFRESLERRDWGMASYYAQRIANMHASGKEDLRR